MITKTLLNEARELQEFFIGTYADKSLEAAITSGNEDLLKIAVTEYGNQRQLIEDSEDATDTPNY